jgi:hypothetical protein
MMCASAGLTTSVLRTFAFNTRFTFSWRATITLVSITLTARLAITSISTATLRCKFRCNKRLVVATRSADYFDALRLFPSTLRSEYGDDVDAIHHEVSVGANDIANLGAGKEQRTVEFPLGQLGAGCSPGPGSVFTSTSEFNFDAA